MKSRSLCLLIAATTLAGCASRAPRSDSSPFAGAALADSSVDIDYVLGHTRRRFLARAKDSAIVAQAYHDQQVLKENPVDQKHYAIFFSKASEFTAAPAREHEDCRDPFTVTVRLGTETKATRGCRNVDGGTLSRLVREGEFLLYSRK